MLILLNGKRKKNKYVFSKKTFSKAVLLILPLYNSSEDALLPFLLYPLIILSSFCLSVCGLNVSIFSKDNAGKKKDNDPGTKAQGDADKKDNLNIGADVDRGTKADNLCIETNVDVKKND